MTEVSHEEALRILADIAVFRASSGRKLEVAILMGDPRWPRTWELFEDGEKEGGHVMAKTVSLFGIAEAQPGKTRCDECRGSFQVGALVLGKSVDLTLMSMMTGSFSPTCISCFASGRGGYLALAIAFLVMET